MVDAWKGLDTFGFIGNTDVSAYQIPKRPHAVDRLTDIPKVIESL